MIIHAGALPRMRAVEAVPMETGDGVMVCLRDPQGVADDAVMLSPAAFLVASLLDGERTLPQLRSALAAQMEGHAPADAEIAAVASELDARGYLETPTFRLKRADALRRWSERSVRPASHAGQAYPAEAAELREMIRGCFTAEGGPGFLVTAEPPPVPRGLIVPHIDFPRGGTAYAHAHKRLLGGTFPELVVVLGVAHAGLPAPFSLTRKAYETPLGSAACDAAAAESLVAGCGEWVTEDDWCHRGEHSIEFQVVWLQALHPEARWTLLPVLCTAFEYLSGPESPGADPRVAAGIAALRAAIRGRRAVVIASVDFSHMGPRFGDDIEMDEALLTRIQEGDRALLAPALAGDAEGFWAAGMADGNERRVDALAAVYTMLAVLGGPSGELLTHGMAPDPAGGIVSFVAAAYP